MSKLTLRRLVVPGNPTPGGAVDVIKFNSLVRVLAITVHVAGETGETIAVSWDLLSKDGLIAIPNLGAQTLSTTQGLPWIAKFIVNQQPVAPATDAAFIVAPGFLPPDFWVAPSEELRISLVSLNVISTAFIYQAIVSYLDTDPSADK